MSTLEGYEGTKQGTGIDDHHGGHAVRAGRAVPRVALSVALAAGLAGCGSLTTRSGSLVDAAAPEVGTTVDAGGSAMDLGGTDLGSPADVVTVAMDVASDLGNGCGAGFVRCGGECTDLGGSPVHCGACGNACGAAAACVAGRCVCTATDQVRCGTLCVQLASDNANCGGCGIVCRPGTVCSASACHGGCVTGLTTCDGVCRDLSTDAAACGACGTVCPAGQRCVAGACGEGSCVEAGTGGPARTLDYVINAVAIDNNTRFDQPHTGFNVDGVWSPPHPMPLLPDCAHQDYFSSVDPDQNLGSCVAGMPNGGPGCQGGVDNQLPDLAQTLMATGIDMNASWNAQITQGRLSMLVRVTDVNGTPGPTLTDCDVGIVVYMGHPTTADCATIFSGRSVFAVDNSSLAVPGDLGRAMYAFRGQVIQGRVQFTVSPGADRIFPTFLAFSMGAPIPVNIHGFQLRASVTDTAGASGNMGGYLLRSETAAAIRMVAPMYASLVDAVIGGLVDLPTGSPPTCDTSVPTAGGIGYGLGFTMVRAVISPVPVGAAPAGACGAGP